MASVGSKRLSLRVIFLTALLLLVPIDCFLPTRPNEFRRPHSYVCNSLSEAEIVQRLQEQLVKLRERDRATKVLRPEELEVCYEDEHLIVVNKPPRVLCVPSEKGIPSLSQTVFERCHRRNADLQVKTMDQMVVHRLGMDTSGLVVFAKTMESLRGLNSLFRTRQVTRQYEALVCGHVENADASNEDGAFGWITLPLMRDWERPPFMRISNEENQNILVGLDPAVVGKRLLEAEKQSLTKYTVMGKEYLGSDGSSSKDGQGLAVTRLTLSAMTGRTHQLNVHSAAWGHPIVGDRIYGYGGDALPNGGLDIDQLEKKNPKRASNDLQKQIAAMVAVNNLNMCIHAKLISFRHPVTNQDVTVSSPAPF